MHVNFGATMKEGWMNRTWATVLCLRPEEPGNHGSIVEAPVAKYSSLWSTVLFLKLWVDMEDLQQLTLHVGKGIDAAFVSDLLLESFGAYSATVTDRNEGTSQEQVLVHSVDSSSLQNVLMDAQDRPDVPMWTEAVVTAYFPGPSECSLEGVVMSLLADFDLPLPAIDAGPVAEEYIQRNWVAHVQQSFQAVTIGNLRIRAPWHDEDSSSSVKNLLLAPEQAFGTGEHPTTQMCVNWIQTFSDVNSKRWSLLDYGCGSGILAIAAVLCGASSAVGCDIDVTAVRTARENAVANNCSDAILFLSNEEESSIFGSELTRYDVVVANILASTLKQLAPMLCSRVSSDGVLVLCGILAEQAAAVATVFARHGIKMEGAAVQAGWSLLVGYRQRQYLPES